MTTDSIPTSGQNNQISTEATPSAIKFGLFVRTREMKAIDHKLREVMLLPAASRTEWLENNEELIHDMMDRFVNESTMALDGLDLDNEAVELSMKYVTTLRDVMTTIRTIMDDSRTLNS